MSPLPYVSLLGILVIALLYGSSGTPRDLPTDAVSYWYHDIDSFVAGVEVNGFAVLVDALSWDETRRGYDLFFDFIESVSPTVDRLNVSTMENSAWPRDWDNCLISEPRRVAHSSFGWYSRTRPSVTAAFQALYKVAGEDMLVSFDRMCALRNSHAALRTRKWLHHDYPPPAERMQSFQGFVNYVETQDVGLRVIPGSEVLLHQFHAIHRMMFYDHEFGITPLLVKAPAGSLVVWKCGLVHDNLLGGVPADSGVLKRLVHYVSYMPRSFASETDLAMRREMFWHGNTSGHWVLGKLGELAGPETRRERELRPLNEQTPQKILEQYPGAAAMIPL